MNELDILRLQYAAPLATLSSFTEVQKAGAKRVLAASDSHASAMEEATMRAQPAVYVTDIEAAGADIAHEAANLFVYNGRAIGSAQSARIVFKHTRPLSREALAKVIADAYWDESRAANDVDHVVDAVLSFIGAWAEEAKDSKAMELLAEAEVALTGASWKCADDHQRGDLIRKAIDKFLDPANAARASLAEAAKAKMDERGPITAEWLWDESRRVGLNKSTMGYAERCDKLPPYFDAYIPLAASINARISPPTPAPQESDVESAISDMTASEVSKHLNRPKGSERGSLGECIAKRVETLSELELSLCVDEALSWFRAHRVVELPVRAIPQDSDDRVWCAGWNHCLASVKSALSRAGIDFKEAQKQ